MVSLEALWSGLVVVELVYGAQGGEKGVQGLAVQAWVPLVILLPMPCLAHGLWCQDCTLANSSHCAPKQCQPTDTVCASVRITDPSSSKTGPGEGTGRCGERSEVSSEFLLPGTRA